MKLGHIILKVSDQERALAFYSTVIGLRLCEDIDLGGYRWLTLTDAEDSVKLLLEPASPPPAAQSQSALYQSSFPALILTSYDIESDVERLTSSGVRMLGPVSDFGAGRMVFFDDGLGNIINLSQPL